MNNPMLSALNRNAVPPNLGQIKNLMNLVRNAGNPQAMLNGLMQNNPQYQEVMRLVQENGNDPKRAFYALAEQKGINPDDVINMLK